MKKILFILTLSLSGVGLAQTGINTVTPDASTVLDVTATDKGVLLPRVALTDITVAAPITTPAHSLLVYNTATAGTFPNRVVPGYYYWDSTITKWIRLDPDLRKVGNDNHITQDAGLGGNGTSGGSSVAFNNVFIGDRAGFSITDGDNNTFIGYNTGSKTTTGYINIFIGDKAGMDNTIGGGNIFMGANSGTNNVSGFDNIFMGAYSGRYNISGSTNLFLGRGAGENSTGNGNIALGYNTGNNLTAGSKNIIMGYDNDFPNATGSNQLNIGNLIYGTGLSSGTTVSSGNVGIGTATPDDSALLEISSTTKGFLPPRMTSAQRDLIAPLTEGLVIYNLDNNCLEWYNSSNWDSPCEVAPIVTAIDCGTTVFSPATSTEDESYTGTAMAPYTGGNGESIASGTTISSTGVNGLTAILQTNTLANGAGNLIFFIFGTPTSGGTADFLTTVGGQTCTFSLSVTSLIKTARVGYTDSYAIGSTNQPTFNSQLNDGANYGSSGTYSGIINFTFTDITASLGTTSGAALKSSYDIISTGFAELTALEASNIVDFVNLGGVVFVLLDSTRGTIIHQAFGGTGTIGVGISTCVTNTNAIHNGVFGNATSTTLTGAGSFGSITSAQLPSGATTLATNGTNPYIWLTGTGDRAIFVWDEGVFRNTSVTGAVDTPQEIDLHNLMAYALNKAGL